MRYGRVALIFAVIAAWFAFQAQAQAQSASQEQDDEVLRVSTNLVTVPFLVKTPQGAYVPNLRREDLRVLEDGVEQEVAHFETVDRPFTIVLMLDVSDSAQDKLRDIQNAAIAFVNQLRPDDRALVVAFDTQLTKMLTEPTGDHVELTAAIRRVKSGGGTALYDAMDTTINSLMKQISGRRAIILLTDGVDTMSLRATYGSTLRLATEQYALIYTIQYDTAQDQAVRRPDDQLRITYTTPSGESLSKAYERGSRYLQRLSDTSGGHLQYSDILKKLDKSFAQIAEELRQHYSVSYYPKNQDSRNRTRRLKVFVNVPNANVHSRNSYAYQSAAQ